MEFPGQYNTIYSISKDEGFPAHLTTGPGPHGVRLSGDATLNSSGSILNGWMLILMNFTSSIFEIQNGARNLIIFIIKAQNKIKQS